MNARQLHLLCLLDALGGTVDLLDFQKLLFLYSLEQGKESLYDFVPYKFGAFSFTSYADRRKLIERGVISASEQCWELTSAGRRAIAKVPSAQTRAFAQKHGALRGDELIAYSYRKYPYYAIRSEIATRVLDGDEEALNRIVAARRVGRVRPLQTIGYEGHSLESYLNTMIRSGVTVLCDVRRTPISRKYGFSKSTLANGCSGVGIRYEHLPELGIASEQRQSLDTQEDYDALFSEYERTYLPTQGENLERIASWIRKGDRVALTCYEHLPQQCHRHCVADALAALLGKDFSAKHL
ncbi:MAG: DUF488 family protein [Polyangiaceae bacterium]